MGVLDYFEAYETPNATNFSPKFVSEVSRISVLENPIDGKEIIVDRINGESSYHRYSEFEAILHTVLEL